ncbi:hypothetical protein J5837_04735 [Pseudoxanthomonas helianthi]|uniref:Uncharacterized protein n=1 Tax=Pseudoxanthomonas helianthi TaxID=1453541 RepID=A0A940X2A4_9GAMM|nr:hypothetical protein [Pseudoxanthomonas helianthi]MBP3983726.1 hypothetical protein [Pseudoxanthomonas helianthi]
MRPTRFALPAAFLLATAVHAHAGDTRYVDLVNRAHDSVTSLSVAPAGSDAFEDVPLEPLKGGGDSATVSVDAEGCRYDFRFHFSNGRTMVYENVDVCRYGKMYIRPLPTGDGEHPYVVR